MLAAVLLGACDGPEQRESAHFERGQAFYKAGNYSKARLEFRNVLQINSRNVEGRYALALVSEAEGNLQQAFVDFQLAVEQKPDHLPSLIKVGQYYLFGNRLDEAMETGSAIVALSPGNADGHALRGAVYLRRDDLPAAQREIGLALQSDPANVAAISAQVGLQRKDGRMDLALATLADAAKTHPGEAGLRLLEVELLVEQGALDKAVQVYQDLIVSDPDNLDYKTNLARLMLKQGRKDEAEAYLRGVAEAASSSPKPKLLLVDFLYNQRDFAAAEAALLGYIKQNPEELAYRFSLAEIYLKQEDGAQAIRLYREIIAQDKTGPKGLIARSALAQVLMAQGEKEAARALIAEVLKVDSVSTEALFLRARDRLEQGDNQGAIADLRTLLRERPELADGRAMLAEAHLRNGEPTLAIEALRTLLEFSPENQAVQVELARQLARTGESASALAILREALARVPDDPTALRVEAEIYAQQKNWPALLKTATTMIQQSPDKALSYYVRGQTYLVQRRFAEAAADFAEVIKLEPDALDPMVGLVQTYLGRNQGKEAEALLQRRLAEAPDNAAMHNLLGELYLAIDKADLAEAAFHAAIKASKDHAPAYGNLARMAARAGRLDQAIQIYSDGLTEAPGDEGLSLSLADAYILNKDYTAAMDVYEAMLTRKSDLPVVANNLAALIADFAPDDKAMLARALELARPFDTLKDPFFLDTLGWVHYRLGNLQQALSYLEQAVTKAPDSPQLNYHLGMAYRAAGQVAKARSALNLAIVDGADYPGVQIARAALADM